MKLSVQKHEQGMSIPHQAKDLKAIVVFVQAASTMRSPEESQVIVEWITNCLGSLWPPSLAPRYAASPKTANQAVRLSMIKDALQCPPYSGRPLYYDDDFKATHSAYEFETTIYGKKYYMYALFQK